MTNGRTRIAVGLTMGAVALAAPGFASATTPWHATGSGFAFAKAKTINPPAATAISNSASTSTSTTLKVTADPAGAVPSTYDFNRVSNPVAIGVCTPVAKNANCVDSNLSANSTYVYSVGSDEGTGQNAWVSATRTLALGRTNYASGALTVSSIALNNGASGGTTGLAEQGDQIVLTFSSTLTVGSVCSTWSNNNNDQSITAANVVSVTLKNDSAPSTGNDQLQFATSSSACGGNLHIGSIDLGSKSFVTGGDAVFSGSTNPSTISYSHSTGVITISLGTKSGSGTPGAVNAAAGAIYTPDANIQSATGNHSVAGNQGVLDTLF